MHEHTTATSRSRWSATIPNSATLAAFLIVAVAGCGGSNSTPATTTTAITKALWVANGTNVLEFLPSQLTAGVSAPAPHLVLNTTTGFGAPQGVQFDAAGDLWVLDGGNGSTVPPAIDEFTAAQLAAHGTPATLTPNKVITYATIKFPQQGVFDANGDFWVADNMANEVVEFTPTQLATGGTVVPNLTLTSTIPFTGPLGIAFSPLTGNLWVANNGGTSIEGFAAASLSGLTGAQTIAPHDVLNDDGAGSIQGPWALVFDAVGDLWSSNANTPFTIVEFLATQLAGGPGATPVPNTTISPVTVGTFSDLAAPNGLAFDNLGDLSAVSSASPFGIPIFAANQLTASGATIPKIFLVGKPPPPTTTLLNLPAGDVFGPAVQ